ncbi:hypothetical protein QCA50_018662 [Cerrena zonata]|uniref:Flavin-containing monooxygenase n=1 Tax=Cerrena zonata TaxID=2478898 RepID=A0AAW0FFP9_9APHY
MDDLPNPLVDLDALHSSDSAQLLPEDSNRPNKHICIIGGGPSGLAALRIVLDHPLYKAGNWNVVVYEAREDIGGVWLPSPPDNEDPPLTPLYDSLTTNLPHPIMSFDSFPFPPSTPLYPPASTVLHYLHDYASHFKLEPHIQFNTLVQSVHRNHEQNKWSVTIRRTKVAPDISGEYADETIHCDLIVVANGHYRLPRYPLTTGLKAWVDAEHATHSVYYRNPSHPWIKDVQKILVVGSGPSGSDVSLDLRQIPSKQIVHSFTGAPHADYEEGRYKTRPRIKEFLPLNDKGEGSVLFADGTVENGIGHCILATGYQDSFPFLEPGSSNLPPLHTSLPPSIPPLPSKLYNSSYHVFPLAKHIFPLVAPEVFPPSSLAFLGLPYRVIPFPLVEAQTRVVLKVFEDPSTLNVAQEAVDIVSHYDELSSSIPPSYPYPKDLAIAKLWHMLDNDAQFEYRDMLHRFAGGDYLKNEWMVPSWVKEMYEKKFIIRAAWKELERRGEASDWVRGVGEGKSGKSGTEEWVDLMRRVLRWAEASHEDEKVRTEVEKTKL